MEKKYGYFLVLFFFTLTIISCDSGNYTAKQIPDEYLDSYLTLDDSLPSFKPRIFSKGTISLKRRFEQHCSFSPDGKAFYFSYTDSAWAKSTIIQVDLLDPSNQQVLTPLTESDYESGQCIDIFNGKFYFNALIEEGEQNWHTEIFYATQTDSGWGNPIMLNSPVNSYICEWHPTITNKGVMYFASERNYDHSNADIYVAIPKRGKYNKVKRLEFNTDINEIDPCVAPDESFLIFASNRPNEVTGTDISSRENGSGELDLYVCFHLGNHKWTEPKRIAAANTIKWEYGPALSPDGKYLFFTRRERYKTLERSNIYWVDIRVIDQYRPENQDI